MTQSRKSRGGFNNELRVKEFLGENAMQSLETLKSANPNARRLLLLTEHNSGTGPTSLPGESCETSASSELVFTICLIVDGRKTFQ